MNETERMEDHDVSTMVEPLGELVLVQIVSLNKIGLIYTAPGSESVLKMRVLACQPEYVNHMGVVVPIKVKPGDFVVPREGFASSLQYVARDEATRAKIKELRGDDHPAMLEDEIALLPYSKIAMRDLTGEHTKAPSLSKREKPKASPGARGSYE